VTLSFHTPESGSRRLFVFSYNHSWRAWQRHTDFGCVLDVASSTVTTKLAHFSLYGVMLEEMGFKANLPAPPPPPSFQTPPPRRTVQPLFYAFGGLVLMALMCGGGLRQVSRFRERRRLRVVACELAEKEQKESAGEEQEEGAWWDEAQVAGAGEDEDPTAVDAHLRRENKQVRRAARLKGHRGGHASVGGSEREEEEEEEEETSESRKRRRRERKRRKTAAAQRREEVMRAKKAAWGLPRVAAEEWEVAGCGERGDQVYGGATPPPAGPRVVTVTRSLLAQTPAQAQSDAQARDSAAHVALRQLGWCAFELGTEKTIER
jgi:hypothetical protein